jgi:hypothetical protein
MVERLTSSSRATEETVLAGRVSRSRAERTRSGVIAGGRSSRTPRAFTAARPSWVHSTITSRRNSASAAKTWNTSRPPGVVVSIASCSDQNPAPRLAAISKPLEAMRRSILRAAFEGELAPAEPTDEPAEILLKRIEEDRASRVGFRAARKRTFAKASINPDSPH